MPFEDFFAQLATTLPLDAFVFFGSLFESIIPVIPAPFILTTAGVLAAADGAGHGTFLWLVLLATIAKTMGSVFYYWVGDTGEDVFFRLLPDALPISHEQVEAWGKRFEGDTRDEITLTLLRIMPIVPETPVSLAAGILKLNMKAFILSTFVGIFVKDALFLYAGVTGLSIIELLTQLLS